MAMGMKDVLKHASAQAVMDRSRRIAFVISLLGLAANCVIASVYGLTSGFTPLLAINFLLQTAAIGSICAASHRDWHFRTVLNTSIAIIYVHLWSTTLYEAWTNTALPLSFVVLLFVPFCDKYLLKPRHLRTIAPPQYFLCFWEQ